MSRPWDGCRRSGLPVLFVLAVVSVRANPAAAPEAPPELQGTWVMTAMVVEGVAAPESRLASARLIITDGDFLWSESGAVTPGTYIVECDSVPWAIDLFFGAGPGAGETALGIWRLDDGWLTLCLGLVGAPRPDDFTALPGSGRALQVFTQDPREVLPPDVGPLPRR